MKRNKFSLSHYKLLTANMGKLVPLTWYETLPGDTIQQNTSCLIRISPLLSPVMHPVRVRIHHWFVPMRLIWDDFEEFITGGEDGDDDTSPPVGTFNNLSSSESALLDYLGIPPVDYSGDPISLSMLPFRAYALIFNNFYRDQDLVTEVAMSTGNGTDSTTGITLQNVAWEKDYFTTSRPWEQKGTAITIPLGDSAPVTGIGALTATYGGSSGNAYETDGSGTVTYTNYKNIDGGAGNDQHLFVEQDPDNLGYPNIRADLSAATGIDINDLRLAMALQKYQEARAMYGSRYVEYLRHLGVRSSDARLQNPEYLGGGRQVISFSEVLSTDGANTGEMYGHGIAAMRTGRFRRFFEEHGIVMTMMSVIPKTIYADGLERKWFRDTKEDYHQRELEHIGQQEVYNREVYSSHTTRDGVFGYQNRYDEYRTMPSGIAGEFRSTLDHWHYARMFSSDPSLNSTFVQASPTKRVNASTSTDCLYVMANHSIQARRPLSRLGRGKLVG